MPSHVADTPPQPGDRDYGKFMALLGRLDERTERMDRSHVDFRTEVREKFEEMKTTHAGCADRAAFEAHAEECRAAQRRSVTRGEFAPIKAVVYGAVGIILLAVFGALVAMVVSGKVGVARATGSGEPGHHGADGANMTPYLMCLEPRHAYHKVCVSGLAHPIFQINISPAYWVSLADQYAIFKKWHRANPGRPIAVLWGRLGTEGFNIDERDATGNLIGTTRAQFDRAILAGGGFKRDNDMLALSTVAEWMAGDGLLPTLNQIDHEPGSTPDWREPMPVRARYDLLRVEHLYGCLRDARLLDRCTAMVVEFCQFASTPEAAFAWDYNGVRVPFNRPISRFQWRTMVYTKILSSSQFYSTDDNRATINLAAWLAECAPGAMPLLQTANVGMFMEQKRLCDRRKAVPIVYTNPVFNDKALAEPTPGMSREELAEFERRRQGAMDWQLGQFGHAMATMGSS